jgi:PST family polysaccharide transporter
MLASGSLPAGPEAALAPAVVSSGAVIPGPVVAVSVDDAVAAAAPISATGTPTGATRAPVPAHAGLDRSLLHGVAWTGAVKWVAQALAWASTLVVARLLTPADYGLVGMAALYMGLVTLLTEFGIGSAVVALRRLTGEQVAQINTLSVVLGVLGFAVSCLAAYPLGLFFKSPQLPWIIVAMSTTFVIASFRAVPWAILQRDLRFKRLAAFEGAQAVVLAAASVLFALAGFRYWTLVLANVLGAAISTAFVLHQHRYPFARPRRESLTDTLEFSRNVLVGRLSFYWFSNADYLVAGRILGKSALGAYSLGYTLAMTPLDRISGMVLRVTPAILSSVQSDRDGLRRYWLGTTEAIALVTFPITWGLALVAPDLVPLALGDRWDAMIVPLQLLSFYAAFRSVLPLTSQLLVATGRTAVDARYALQSAIVMPTAFLVGSHWGVTGIALGWVLVHPFFGVRLVRRGLAQVDLPIGRYGRALWPALSSALVMAMVVGGIAFVVPSDWPPGLRVCVEVVAGAAAYCGALALLHRDRLRAFLGMAKTLRRA